MVDSDIERFAAAMVVLYKAFSKPIDKDINKICFLTLKHLTIEDAEQCISLAVMNEDRFPTPSALKRMVTLIPPRQSARIEHQPFGHQDEKLAEHSGKLVNGYLAGKLTRKQLIEGMQVMHRQYPTLGWDRQAAQMVCFFRETPEGGGSGLAVNL